MPKIQITMMAVTAQVNLLLFDFSQLVNDIDARLDVLRVTTTTLHDDTDRPPTTIYV